MKNAKFWLVQIAMVAIVSFVLGSPVLAGGKGIDNGTASASGLANASNMAGGDGGEGVDGRGHAGSHSSGGGNAGGNSGGGNNSGGDGEGEPSCSEATGPGACTNEVDCLEVFGGIGAFWDGASCNTF